MKKLILIAALSAPLWLGMTCAPNPQTVAYNTIYSVEVSTTAAFDAYLTSVVKGAVSTNALPQVSAAYNEFQLAAKTATLIVAGDSNAPAPPTLVSASAKVTTAISTAK